MVKWWRLGSQGLCTCADVHSRYTIFLRKRETPLLAHHGCRFEGKGINIWLPLRHANDVNSRIIEFE